MKKAMIIPRCHFPLDGSIRGTWGDRPGKPPDDSHSWELVQGLRTGPFQPRRARFAGGRMRGLPPPAPFVADSNLFGVPSDRPRRLQKERSHRQDPALPGLSLGVARGPEPPGSRHSSTPTTRPASNATGEMWAAPGRTWKAAPKCAMPRKSLSTGKRKSRESWDDDGRRDPGDRDPEIFPPTSDTTEESEMGINRRNFLRSRGGRRHSCSRGEPVGADRAGPSDPADRRRKRSSSSGSSRHDQVHRLPRLRRGCNAKWSLPKPEVPFSSESVFEKKRNDPGRLPCRKPVPERGRSRRSRSSFGGSACTAPNLPAPRPAFARRWRRCPKTDVYHKDRCMGCRYCMISCPFDIPKFQYDSASRS